MKRLLACVLFLWTLNTALCAQPMPEAPPACPAEAAIRVQASSDMQIDDSILRLLQSPCLRPTDTWPPGHTAPLNLGTQPAIAAPAQSAVKKDLPEPATIALIGLGAVGVCSYRRRWHWMG